MSSSLDTPYPNFHPFEFNLKKGTKLRVTTVDDIAFDGYVFVNPIVTGVPGCITLCKIVPVDKKGNVKQVLNIRRFFETEIQSVTILKHVIPQRCREGGAWQDQSIDSLHKKTTNYLLGLGMEDAKRAVCRPEEVSKKLKELIKESVVPNYV